MFLFGLAWAGGSISYVPLLTILLPVRVEQMAGPHDVTWLAYVAFFGAIAASIGNIGFGWLSDITGSRRGWIAAGMTLSVLLLVSIGGVETLSSLIAIIIAWQLALNMMLGPLAAWAGDCVPDWQKGTLGGMMAFAPALGALAGALVTIPDMASADTRLILVAGMVLACALPVLVFGAPVPFPELTAPKEAVRSRLPRDTYKRATVIRMWVARLLVQISEAALFSYLYLWFRSLDPTIGDSSIAQILSFVLMLAVPLALLAGRWSDRYDRPVLVLSLGAGLSAVALWSMAIADSLPLAIAGYVMFGLAAGVFLSLHTALTLRFLPQPARRGRDVGLFNLTNTLPSLVMPWLTLALVPAFGFGALFLLLGLLAALASILLSTINHRV